VNGVARTYALYVPSSAMTAIASGPVPLVIAFHGAGDTGSNFIAWNGLAASASSDALIVVGADGYPGNGGVRGWFLSASEGWPGTDGYSSSTANDLSFATQIKNEVGGLYNISTKRVFACGFSRGAGLTVLLAESSGNPGVLSGTWSSPFAAYGASAGYDPFGGSLSLSGTTPKRPVWMIHGTSDAAVPYSQGQSCANALIAAGFPTTFTTVSGAPHDWLWSTSYGHGNQELIDFFLANPSP
jgi:poly(3-hydroxybutyrate) depolymerase